MIFKIINLGILLILFNMIGCETTSVESTGKLSGEYVLKGVFLSDALDSPCGWEAGEHKDITINFTNDAAEANTGYMQLSGISAVNHFFGTYKIKSFDGSTGTGTIEVSTLGSTKMAGPPLLMQCETRFFDYLSGAKDFSVENDGTLKLGNFRKPDSHPRDGGTYLIFAKK